MYVKKSISLLLSGALFASLCTGCSQTTMEHHFFTDSVTETEINTEVVGANLPKIDELQTFLSSKGIELEVFLNSDGIAGTADISNGSSDLTQMFITLALSNPTSSVNSEALSTGINDSIFYVFCYGEPHEKGGLSVFLSDTENAINLLYNAFEGLDESDFTTLKNELAENINESNLFLGISGLHDSDNKYYVVALLTKMGSMGVEWK